MRKPGRDKPCPYAALDGKPGRDKPCPYAALDGKPGRDKLYVISRSFTLCYQYILYSRAVDYPPS